jgi:hypothetical protein
VVDVVKYAPLTKEVAYDVSEMSPHDVAVVAPLPVVPPLFLNSRFGRHIRPWGGKE